MHYGQPVTEPDDQLQVAAAAWQILQASGGLLNRADIARRLEISDSRAWQLVRQRHFPEPAGEVGGRPVWLAAAVEHYRQHPPPTGRPRKETVEHA